MLGRAARDGAGRRRRAARRGGRGRRLKYPWTNTVTEGGPDARPGDPWWRRGRRHRRRPAAGRRGHAGRPHRRHRRGRPPRRRGSIDATGKVVTPGFVDVHTHYDAQVFWDGDLTPSPLHGVTTALAGNCGFTIAPLSGDAADGDYLMRMLARVEGMPLESLREPACRGTGRRPASTSTRSRGASASTPASWSGHSAIRRVVMGAEAVGRAGDAGRARRGCSGCCATRSRPARSGSPRRGRAPTTTPTGTWCRRATRTHEEIVELCRVTRRVRRDVARVHPAWSARTFEPWAIDLMADMSATAQRPLNWNVLDGQRRQPRGLGAQARRR